MGVLEEELMGLGEDRGRGPSPDRADALVWAITNLMLSPGALREGPRAQML
jgi:phage terminase large subunit-like protein